MSVRIELGAEAGMRVALFDQQMRQGSEWVELVVDRRGDTPGAVIPQGGFLLATFADPDREITFEGFVVWDDAAGIMQPKLLDMPITVRPGSVPVELRILPEGGQR
jgi:hypothetical protein